MWYCIISLRVLGLQFRAWDLGFRVIIGFTSAWDFDLLGSKHNLRGAVKKCVHDCLNIDPTSSSPTLRSLAGTFPSTTPIGP